MQIENDILKLKLKAQFGKSFQMVPSDDLPPEIENEFLKNVLAFEDKHQHAKYTKVYERLSNPVYKKANELSDKEISEELTRIEEIMEKNNMTLDVLAEYDDRIIYTFLTEELFEHETEAGEGLTPGMVRILLTKSFTPITNMILITGHRNFYLPGFSKNLVSIAGSWQASLYCLMEVCLPNKKSWIS